MRISQVIPLWERVFPVGYSGIELIVDPLKYELVCRGHESTLFSPVQKLIKRRGFTKNQIFSSLISVEIHPMT
ncbi:hypothetical protein [Okeania sp. KiyG1]|uniref:hypothetical protein n=1 Tax=Okeania sp. KiyG1 TaxID=2720165 RepID=UPI001922B4E5|nr:hypothetical protein [Okeania sp. KiyG1]GGA36905.1 hypothetical protein CYANOKiyG1_54880 [Okeania sp. KiyG1]